MTDLIALNDASKVWIYMANEPVSLDTIAEIQKEIRAFVTQWVSHTHQLKAYGNIFHQRFIVLVVDETQTSASGCSIDSSVRFIQDVGNAYNRDFLTRDQFAYIHEDEVVSINMHDVKSALQNGIISKETLFFDTLVKTKEDFITSWLKPLKDSWHARFI